MTSSGFLDFFILEASEYIEQLDGMMPRGSGEPPDPDGLVRSARALRGSATMAKLPPFAELATGLERVGRALRERTLAWSPALSGALVAAVDDLKILLRAARSWTPADESRAAARSAELAGFVPASSRSVTGPATTARASSGSGFFGAEASNIAAGLELLATRPADRDAATNVLRRVRALRGVAGIQDVPPLAEVMESAELVAKPLELGEGALTPDRISLLRFAAGLLRRVASALREGTATDGPSPERTEFFNAFEAFQARERAGARIVPIAELFYPDGGPHVVSTAPNPPTTPTERFRLEVVSQGEYIRGLIAEARASSDAAHRERLRRSLRHALLNLGGDAESFGETEVAELVSAHLDAVNSFDYLAMNALEALSQVLASPGTQGERLAARLAELRQGRTIDVGIGDAFRPVTSTPAAPPRVSSTAPTPIVNPVIRADAPPPNVARPQAAPAHAPIAPAPPPPPAAPTPAPIASVATPAAPPPAPPISSGPPPAPAAAAATPVAPFASHLSPAKPTPVTHRVTPTSKTPPGAHPVSTPRDTMAVLDQGIDSLSSMAALPMSEPVDLPDQPVVPIDALLYRGRAAIERAIELREAIRSHGGSADAESLDELFDLLDLALAD